MCGHHLLYVDEEILGTITFDESGLIHPYKVNRTGITILYSLQ